MGQKHSAFREKTKHRTFRPDKLEMQVPFIFRDKGNIIASLVIYTI